ncbi:MAG: thiol:disulfide interchange protein [Bacteroidetes bacterium]|nr:thiol:disulfide interchange protein [Bacteroidota bacterium]
MSRFKLLIALLFISVSSFAQIIRPVHWTWKAEKVKNDEYKVTFTAVIDKPWHTYGMNIQDGGPVKTSFAFDKNADVQLVGKMTETGPKMKDMVDDVFQVKVRLFEEKAVFEQTVKAKKGAKVTGTLEFMACDDKSCLAPERKKFEIVIP